MGPYASLNLARHVGDEDSAVGTNRGIVADAVRGPVVFMRPAHGVAVAYLDESYLAGREPPVADVLITTVRGLSVATLAADCVPLLVHDAESGAVAAVHVGREGLLRGVVDTAVAAIMEARHGGVRQESVTFSIGPAICGRCYEVSSEVRAEVTARYPLARSTTRWATPALDLPQAVAGRLAHLGFDRVVRHRRCTFEEPRLFSYRRDRLTGRQAGVVSCDGPPA